MGWKDATLSPEYLDELEAIARAATPGPWKNYHPSEFKDDYRIAVAGPHDASRYNGGYIGRLTRSHDPEQSSEGSRLPREEDARFIVHANPAMVLALIARIRELESKASG